MGMNIDESMKVLQEVPKVMPITKESINVALDTMHKYQKIKNIICKWEDGLYDDEGVSHVEVLDMISNEVN